MITTSSDSKFSRVAVDNGQTSLEEGREFRIVREMTQPIGKRYWKFTSAVDFILFKQSVGLSVGDIKFRAYRSEDVTDSEGWNGAIPIFAKNISNEYREYSGQRYETQVLIETGGSVVINNPDNYVDYVRAKTSNATAQQSTVGSSDLERRYLAAGTYYFEFDAIAISEWRIELAWEERP